MASVCGYCDKTDGNLYKYTHSDATGRFAEHTLHSGCGTAWKAVVEHLRTCSLCSGGSINVTSVNGSPLPAQDSSLEDHRDLLTSFGVHPDDPNYVSSCSDTDTSTGSESASGNVSENEESAVSDSEL